MKTITTILACTLNFFVDGTIIIGANMQNLAPTQTGQYSVVTTDLNGCTAASAPHDFLVSDIYNLDSESDFIIIPNPNSGQFRIRTGEFSCADLKIYHATGVVVYQREKIEKSIYVGYLGNGAYFIECSCGGKIYSRKLVIQR